MFEAGYILLFALFIDVIRILWVSIFKSPSGLGSELIFIFHDVWHEILNLGFLLEELGVNLEQRNTS